MLKTVNVGAVHGGLLLIYLSDADSPLKRVKLGSIKRTNRCTDGSLGMFFRHCTFVLLVGNSWPYFLSRK